MQNFIKKCELALVDQKVRNTVIEALKVQDFDTAVINIIDLLTKNRQSILQINQLLDIALEIVEHSKNYALKGEVLYVYLLNIYEDEIQRNQMLDEAIQWARQEDMNFWFATFLQLQLFWNVTITKDVRASSFLTQVYEVDQAYQIAENFCGRISSLISFACLIAFQHPLDALILLKKAEQVLEDTDQSQLIAPPETHLIQFNINIHLNHQKFQPGEIREQWQILINQKLSWIQMLNQ